jgi:alanine racemase
VAVAHHALRCGVQALGVGTSAEALELRQSGVRVPILVLGTIVDEEADGCLRNGIHIALHSLDRARMLQELAQRLGGTARVHVKVDTAWDAWACCQNAPWTCSQAVRESPSLSLCGLMTHVAAPEGAADPAAIEQLALFESVLRKARERKLMRGGSTRPTRPASSPAWGRPTTPCGRASAPTGCCPKAWPERTSCAPCSRCTARWSS